MFDRAEYDRFCSTLMIDSKEFGTIPLRHLGTQIYLIDEIVEGLNRGIHEFDVLKARQLGISTECWALDLYWLFKHPGLRGTLVTHDDETREEGRANLTSYMSSLPKAFKIPARVHNRNMLDLKNRSRLSYQVAGTKKSGKLGRGKGLNFCHATEVSSYGDEESFDSLLASLAETYEDRLYIFESTARGFNNLWYEVCKEAKNSVTQKFIFIGWWRNELYRVSRGGCDDVLSGIADKAILLLRGSDNLDGAFANCRNRRTCKAFSQVFHALDKHSHRSEHCPCVAVKRSMDELFSSGACSERGKRYTSFDSLALRAMESKSSTGCYCETIEITRAHSDIFEVYGMEDPTPQEYEWIDGVKKIYGIEIEPEQLAWARWKLYEKHRGNETSFFQEFPPLEEYAWQMTGSKFFSARKLTDSKMMMEKEQPPADYYRYTFGPTFDMTSIAGAAPFQAQLTVWEEPDPLGVYCISGDPAFGANEKSDRSCIQVIKCFADGCEQVAEFCTTECTTYAFAWILGHLAGAYRDSMVILEINGPGRTVWDEFQRIQQTGGYSTPATANAGIMDVVGNIRNYLYHRSDSLSGNFAYHFKSTHELKIAYMNKFRDAYERGLLLIRSAELLEEMKTVTQDDDVIGAGSSRQKDDRAIAMGLAIQSWQDGLLPDLYERHWTRAEHFAKTEMAAKNGNVLAYHLSDWLQRFKPEMEQ